MSNCALLRVGSLFRIIAGAAIAVPLLVGAMITGTGPAMADGQSFPLTSPKGVQAGSVTATINGAFTQLSVTLNSASPRMTYNISGCIGAPFAIGLSCGAPIGSITTDGTGAGSGTATFGALAPNTVIQVVNAANPSDTFTAVLTLQATAACLSFNLGTVMGTVVVSPC